MEPELKRRLYASLSLSGSTFKDWFMKTASRFCEEQQQPYFLKEVRYGPSRRSKTLVVREHFDQAEPATAEGSSRENGAAGKSYTVVSMFSGCGGMDLGFTGGFEVFGRRYRSLPFEVVWANDSNGAACKTYRRNLGHDIHRGDVWSLMDTLPTNADVVVRGFPCQDISLNGKWADVNGARSGLYRAVNAGVQEVGRKVLALVEEQGHGTK